MRVLIIGLGSIAKKHIKSIINYNQNSIIYAFRSSNSFSKEENVINIISLEDFAQPIDFIIVSNPTALHGSTILNLIKFKVPFFIEKPVLHNLELANLLLDEIKNNEIVTYVGCNLRFHPAIQFIKKYLSNNNPQINEVNIYSGSDLTTWRPEVDYKLTYSANSNLGGGVHLDLIHEIDYCLWIFGIPQKVNSVFSSKSNLEIDSIDSARYIFEYYNFNAGITLNYYRKDTRREIEILTEKETITIDLVRCKIYNNSTLNSMFEQEYNIQQTYDSQISYFIDCIKNNTKPMNSFEEGINTLKIALNE